MYLKMMELAERKYFNLCEIVLIMNSNIFFVSFLGENRGLILSSIYNSLKNFNNSRRCKIKCPQKSCL